MEPSRCPSPGYPVPVGPKATAEQWGGVQESKAGGQKGRELGGRAPQQPPGQGPRREVGHPEVQASSGPPCRATALLKFALGSLRSGSGGARRPVSAAACWNQWLLEGVLGCWLNGHHGGSTGSRRSFPLQG